MRYFISAESYFAHQLLSENAAVKVAITLSVCFLPVCVCCMCPFLFHSVCMASLPYRSQWLLRHNQKALLNLSHVNTRDCNQLLERKTKQKNPYATNFLICKLLYPNPVWKTLMTKDQSENLTRSSVSAIPEK